MSHTVVLPEQLAPALAARVRALLAEVRIAAVPEPFLPRRVDHRGPRCVVCPQGGPLGGHHERDGSVSWVHKSCHRKLHARHRARRAARFRQQRANG